MNETRFRSGPPPVPLAVLADGFELTEAEAREVVLAIHAGDDRRLRRLLIRGAVRLERGEELLARLGWRMES